MKAIQLYYPPEWAHCYGCGYLNAHGLHIKTYWDPEKGESETRVTPRPYHTAIPGFVYGGLLASLVDCHSTATAAAAKAQAEGLSLEATPLRFVTASLKVDFLKPTPLGPDLRLVGRPKEVKGWRRSSTRPERSRSGGRRSWFRSPRASAAGRASPRGPVNTSEKLRLTRSTPLVYPGPRP